MSGLIGVGPDKTSGIIGMAAHDVEKNSWHLFPTDGAVINNAVVDFDGVATLGNRCTDSAGRVTVLDGGLYWISVGFSKDGDVDNYTDVYLRIDTTKIQGTRLYVQNRATGAGGAAWEGESASWAIPLNAGQIVDIFGGGRYQGAGSPSSQSFFSGVRIGA